MPALTPVRIDEFATYLEARFADGTTVTLGFDGQRRTCLCREPDCRHLRALLPAYTAFKWRRAEANRNAWGPTMYRNLHIDPKIFYPAAVDWACFPDEDVVRVEVRNGRSYEFRDGYVYQFRRDGAYLAILATHPDGGTKCSLCGTRSCRHWQAAREWQAETEVAA